MAPRHTEEAGFRQEQEQHFEKGTIDDYSGGPNQKEFEFPIAVLTTEGVVADAVAAAVDGAEYVKLVDAGADADVVSEIEVEEVGRMTVVVEVVVHTKVGHTRYEEAGADCNGLFEEGKNGKTESRTSTS